MKTNKRGRVAYANTVYFELFNGDENVATVTMTKFGKATLSQNDQTERIFGNIANELINFEFKKKRKFLSLEDNVSGVKVTIKGTTITVAVPNNIYRANVEGLGQSNHIFIYLL